MSELNPALLLKAARNAAWRLTPPSLSQWREDIAQDAVEQALRMDKRGFIAGPLVLKWGVLHAVRRLSFLLRYQVELPPDFDEPVEGPAELGPIALWRLQAVWGDLTDVERLALGQLISGEQPTQLARRARVSGSSIFRARITALKRIDNPKAFTRGREYQRIRL